MKGSNLVQALEIFLQYDSNINVGVLKELNCLYLLDYDEYEFQKITSEDLRALEQLGWGQDSELRWVSELEI